MVESIKNIVTHDRVQSARILFVGPIRAGKSSFINTVASIDKGRIASPMEAGEDTRSLSTRLKQYKPTKHLQNFILLDTMGIEEEEEEGFNLQDVIYLINGNVKPNYHFNTRNPINPSDTTHFIKNPTLADKAHCIVIVFPSPLIDTDSVTDETKKKIGELKQYIRDNDVPIVILLTKIDEIDDEVEEDITQTYLSRPVEDVVNKTHELFGIQQMNIFPVRNYTMEEELDNNMNILVLLAIRKMLRIASDRLESQEQNEQLSEMTSNLTLE